MIKESLLPADTFILVNKTILNESDRKNIIMLYQPIIGYEAVSLYFTLWTYLDKREIMSDEITHHELVTTMGLKLSKILESREKLEAMGLLKTYLRKSNINNYVYEIYSPVSAYEFLNNPVLAVSLYNNIGKTEYEKIVEYYRIPKISLKDYTDITCSFNDVFKSTNISSFDRLENINKVVSNNLNIESKIDFNSLLGLIPDEVLNKRSLTDKIKDLIIKISFIYDYDEDVIAKLVRESLTDKKTIDRNTLRNNARKYYQFENSGKLPSIVYRTQPEYLRKPIGDVSNRAKAIYQFETTSPYDYLRSKYKNNEPTKTDTKILEYLLLDMNLNPGVVNVLIDYILKINNNKLNKNYVDAIASQWAKSKIETVEEAMNIAEKEYKKNKKIEKPEWFDKQVEKQVLKEEEIEDLDELLSKFSR